MKKTDHKLRIRPRFRKEIADAPETAINKIKSALDSDHAKCKGTIVDHHVILLIPQHQQHYWSPQLALELEALPEGSRIRGLYGPKPEVWTMFVFFYSAIGFLTLMGSIFGLSQMMLSMNPYGLWSVPIGGILLLGLFIISKIGERLGQDQMHQLKDFLDKSLE